MDSNVNKTAMNLKATFYGSIVDDEEASVVALTNPLDVMPVGYIYMTVDAISPDTLFGGTWSVIGQGYLFDELLVIVWKRTA